MSKFYHVIRDHHSKWIKSPNNGGECCTTQEDTVEALNQLIQERDALQYRVKRLEEAGDILESDKRALKAVLSDLGVVGSMGFGSTLKWIAAKESKP